MCLFKKIPGYSTRYTVSKSGIIRGPRGCLTSFENEKEYLCVNVTDLFGNRVKRKVHRLVALAWLHNPNPNVLVHVDHIDRCKNNCHVDNLRWIDESGNSLNNDQKGCYKSTNKAKPYRARVTLNKQHIELGYFKSEHEASHVAKEVRECLLNIYLRALYYAEDGRSSSFC